jgi:hypothetical protein
MAGLILAGIGKGIADAGSTMANIGIRGYETREAARLRREEKEEDRVWREEQKELDRDRQDERDRMYRRTAEQQAAGNKGTGGDGISGFDPKDLEPGGKLSPYMAARAGMSTEDYEKQVTAMKTKDMSGYATETRDAGKVLDDEYGEQTVTEKVVPEAFKKEFAAKAKVIGDLVMNYAAGKEAKTIAEGEQIGLVTGAVKGVLEGKGNVTETYQALGALKGQDRFKEGGGVVLETATGTNKETAVGTATIAEKGATAGAQNKLAEQRGQEILKIGEEIKEIKAKTGKLQAETGQVGKDGGKDTDKTQERLSSVVNATNATIRSLEETKPPASSPARAAWDTQYADALALRAEATRLQKEALGARAAPPPPPPPPAATDTSGRKKGDTTIVQSGPNKGKTAVWDGTGWKLK